MDATSATVTWLVAAMTAWSPPGREHFITEAKEAKSAAETRYEEIAKAIVKVTYDPSSTPIFKGDKGRAMDAMLLESIAFNESGFRRDVDLGLGKYGRGDGGQSHCMLQIHIGIDRKDTSYLQRIIGKAWSADDLVTDRTKCFITGYELAKKSFMACKDQPLKFRLAAYASGKCTEGHEKSEDRVSKALKRVREHAAPNKDSEVMAELQGKVEQVTVLTSFKKEE